MAKNYGNSHGIKEYPSVGVRTLNAWHRITSRIPVGGVLAKSDEWPEGKVIPLGTPVSMTEIGGAATVGAAADLTLPYSGLLEHDTPMGPDCCTLDVIDGGELLIDRIDAKISDEQKEAVKARIKFYPQIKD
jgi:hypothetical protein